MHRIFFVLSLWALPVSWMPAHAHEGHGIEGASHYHATDVWGFVAFAGVVVVMWWMGRGK